jgi:hypothetical protein
MPLYEMDQVGNENRVYVGNSANHFGTKLIGSHFVTFSGCGDIKDSDRQLIMEAAKNEEDIHLLQSEIQITVGPKWRNIHQCSPLIAPNQYINTDADEDDAQGWNIFPCTWETVESEGAKRIRLKFSMGQRGQKTLFFGIGYQATATGDLWPQ